MNKIACFLVCGFLVLSATTGLGAPFDERLWEKYFVINGPSGIGKGDLLGVYLDPYQFGEITAKPSFADLRVITDQKIEVPWQLVVRRSEYRKDELPALMRNLSQTDKGDTWLELLIENIQSQISAVDINTPDTNFSRQVQVLGSTDGQTWNTLRKDGVIFDSSRGEKLHHTRITFPSSRFPHLALKINNNGAPPLTIKGVKVLLENHLKEQTYSIQGKIEKSEINKARQETSLIVTMDQVFPIDRLVINVTEENFQRSLEVQVKQKDQDWTRWAQGTIFNFNTDTMKESRLSVEIPEIAAREFRLVFKNYDSPPLSVTSVLGQGYRRLLVFKQQPDRKFYLFWGNPLAQMPRYDLADLVARQKLEEIPLASLDQAQPNNKFAGSKARLPFTERYKFLLYLVFGIAIVGLLFLQYRVLKRMKQSEK
jgi:hypothetical protein